VTSLSDWLLESIIQVKERERHPGQHLEKVFLGNQEGKENICSSCCPLECCVHSDDVLDVVFAYIPPPCLFPFLAKITK